MKERICLVTPGHLSTNPRLVKEADALCEAGYDVTVVSARYMPWADSADLEFGTRRWRSVKVAFGRMAGARKHLSQRLKQEAFRSVYSMTRRGLVQAFHPVASDLIRTTLKIPADLYIAHNLAALPAASRAAERHSALFGFDAEDFHRGQWPLEESQSHDAEMTRDLEARYISRCAHLTASSPLIAEAYERALQSPPIHVVLNVFPSVKLPPTRQKDGQRSLYWFSQTLGPDRGIENVISALSLSQSKPVLVLRGLADDNYLNHLFTLARSAGVLERVRVVEPASPSSMTQLAAEHDIGIASETSVTENHQYCLSNKIFTYLAAGIPILASATRAQAELAKQLESAMFIYEEMYSNQLAHTIDQLLLDERELEKAKAAARRAFDSKYSWNHEAPAFLDLVRRNLSKRAGSSAA